MKSAQSAGNIGPNLDTLKPSMDQIIYVVTNGVGVMQSWEGILTKEEIEAVIYERVRDRDGSGGSGFAEDPRNRTPEEEEAHQAKVRAMRAKEPKTERQLAAAWLEDNPEVEEQVHDLAMKKSMAGEADYRQVYDDKALELYRQSVK